MVVIYELPCRAYTRWSASDQTGFIVVPVYHSASIIRSLHNLLAIPFYIAIPLSEAHDESAIYARLIERYTAWSVYADEFYDSQASMGVTSNQVSTSNSISRQEQENADAWLETLDIPSVLKRIVAKHGSQDALFNIRVYPPSRPCTDPVVLLLNELFFLLGEYKTLSERVRLPCIGRTELLSPHAEGHVQTKQSLIKSGDTILCDWDIYKAGSLFDISLKARTSPWVRWAAHKDPKYLAESSAQT